MQEKFSHGHQRKKTTWLFFFVLNEIPKEKNFNREVDAYYILAPPFARLIWSTWRRLQDPHPNIDEYPQDGPGMPEISQWLCQIINPARVATILNK